MDLEAREVPTYERNFGHCIISWNIKNFSLAACNAGTEIFTKEFTVSSPRVTRWQIGFRVESDSSKLQLFLKRLGDKADESFKVSWKISILNGKGEGAFVTENRSYIHGDSKHQIEVISPLDILKALPAAQCDEVRITWQMIVHMNTPANIPTPPDDGMAALIEDMAVVAKEGLHSDVLVSLNGKTIKSHRAVLCPRSERLSHSARYDSRKIQLYLSDSEAVNSLFAYLYTGDLKYILDPPSISVYDYIVHLNIQELRDSYPHEKVSLENVIEATKFEFRWTIPDFTSCDEPRDSEIYEADGMGSTWQLRIYPKGLAEGTERQKKYVYIEALALNSEGSQNVYLDFRAKNDQGLITVARRTHGKISSGKKLGVLFMRIGGYSMAKSVVGNVLDLSFSVHRATGKTNSTVTETHPPVPFNLTNFDTYCLLTTYMGVLQTQHLFSDVKLSVQEHEFKAHKFLLAGRSATFSHMVQGIKDDNTSFVLNNMHKHVFRVFLDYLYRAVLTDHDIRVLLHLYDMAVHFLVQPLQKLCEKHITRQLTYENSCYLLLYAEERNSASLKTEILQYIADSREKIIDNEGWRNMEAKNPQLFYDVVYFLGNRPTEPPEQRVQQ